MIVLEINEKVPELISESVPISVRFAEIAGS